MMVQPFIQFFVVSYIFIPSTSSVSLRYRYREV